MPFKLQPPAPQRRAASITHADRISTGSGRILRLCLPFCSSLLAVLSIVSLALTAPTIASAQAVHSSSEIAPSRADVFLGYAYWHPLGGTIFQRPFTPIKPGAVLSGSGYFGRYIGLQLEGGFFPNGDNDSIYTAEAGPIARYPIGRFSPFIHALGGGARVSGPASQPATWGWALTGGLGVDYILPLFGNRLAVRPQADYQFSHTDFGPIGPNGLTGGLAEVRAYRLTGGLVYRFGASSTPSRPLAYGCTAEPSTVFPGDPVTITGSSISSRHTNAKHLAYTWATTGGHILSGEGNGAPANENATVATTGLAPGDYLVTGHLVEGKRASERATCTTSFTVQPPPPPTLTCSASPVAITPGGQTIINSYGNSPQNRPLRYTYSTTAGQIIPYANTVAAQQNQQQNQPGQIQQNPQPQGRIAVPSNRVVLDTTGLSAGTINVACTVTDDLNQTASATAVVQLNTPPAALATPQRLCTLSFERDLRRPARVNNEGKACLDDVALSLNRDPGAKLTITGESAPRESKTLAQQRAINARAYLVDEKGIDPNRLTLRVGTSNDRTAHLTLFPFGAPPDLSGTDDSAGAPAGYDSTQPSGQRQSSTPDTGTPQQQSFRPSPGTLTNPRSLIMPPIPSRSAARSRSSRAHRRSRSTAAQRRHTASSAAAADSTSTPVTPPNVIPDAAPYSQTPSPRASSTRSHSRARRRHRRSSTPATTGTSSQPDAPSPAPAAPNAPATLPATAPTTTQPPPNR